MDPAFIGHPTPSQLSPRFLISELQSFYARADVGVRSFLYPVYVYAQAHVKFFLWNPVHIEAMDQGCTCVLITIIKFACSFCCHHPTTPILFPGGDLFRGEAVPYGLRFPEDVAACSLVSQAVMGREDR